MDIKDFKAGKYVKQIEYSSFLPDKIFKEWIISSPKINQLLSEANRLLGELNAFSQLIPDVDFFIKMHISKEATTSSRLEGTKTNMEEALLNEEEINPEKRDDWKEVQNYINAINYSISELEKLPLSNRLLKNTHNVLLAGVRGKHKLPGEFRKSQNWLGATLKDAIYIPSHHTDIPDLMSDLEKFLNDNEFYIPHLVKIAIAHYQFETIHPFLDGNGRLGRLMITLYLVSNNILKKPALYLSDFFEKHREYYYDNLMRVRSKNDLEQWITFFLVGVIETSKSSIQVFKDIIRLKSEIENYKIPKMGSKAEKGIKILRILFQNPIITSNKLVEEMNIAHSTANRLLADFEKLEIIEEYTGFKRNRKYIFKDYFELFNKKE
ncbi:adenosine monophosphate-protein transferase SoFic [bacterium BMS3Abin04]|nr:adenosine monophosphate-protein transferase SoFic [bacterium BMS3Abin04]